MGVMTVAMMGGMDRVVSSAAESRSPLIGREAEVRRVDELVEGLPGRGGALVVGGEAGIGKSELLGRARERAGVLGLRTLGAVGVESEAALAFAGLHQLLLPVLDLAVALPDPQRQALRAAFGEAAEVEPDRFLVAVAAFGLLAEAAAAGPLLLIVDDAQWLDPSSLAVLTFVARRLEAEPIALIAGVRDGHPTPLAEARLPELRLDPLPPDVATALLNRAAPDLPPLMRDRVQAEAAGNPLALVELARVVPLADVAGERVAPPPPTLTARLESAFAADLDQVPTGARLVMLAAALDGRAPLAELLAAASAVNHGPLSVADLDPAVAARLVAVEAGGLAFRHPLIRSAVRQAALPGVVLALYAALAEVVADPERRLWNRASAAIGLDEEIAAALEAQAAVALRRGAVGVAAAAYERAAALTPDPARQGRRLVAAADVAYDLGLVEAVRRLIRLAEPLPLADLDAARLDWLRQMIGGDIWVQSGAARTFVAIATQMAAGGDSEAALRSLVPIAHRSWWTRTRKRTRRFLVEAAAEVARPGDDALRLAVVALADPEGTAPAVRDGIAALAGEATDPLAAMDLGIAAEKAGDFATGSRLLARALDGLREQGRLGPLNRALVHYAWSATHTGEWEAAAAAGTEARRLANDTRQPEYGMTGALVAAIAVAHLGTEADLDRRLAKPEAALFAAGGGSLLAPAHLARGADAIGDGRYADAFRHLWPIFDDSAPPFHRFMRWSGLLDLVEAAVAIDSEEQAARVAAELEQVAERGGQPYLLRALACARPLLADDDEAEDLYATALAGAVDYPFIRARTLFSQGRWLRRRRRSADSREPLREAVETFDALGATRWAARARLELRASGETVGRRTADARDRLTAQELQIGRLAAEGLSNREIGERLFLSPRTIGSHLYRIFPKLGITSRAQLGEALAGAEPPPGD
jgi:DNA-binding CsgD family transcriptional regulator